MKYLFPFGLIIAVLFCLSSCGDSAPKDQTPNNFPSVQKEVDNAAFRAFGRGLNSKIVTFQQYHESGGKRPQKHLIAIAKPSKGRELKLKLPLDMERIRKFGRIETDKFEGTGSIDLTKEHLFKDKNQKEFWQYHKDSTSKEVFLQEGTYSLIRKQDFEMLHIYDSANDIEYMEMKMKVVK